MKLNTLVAMTIATAALTGSWQALAQDEIAEFYSGKEVQMIIRASPGGGYDEYSRLLARHMSRHIPGNPAIIPVNMPGAGGLVAANHVFNLAPKDGTVLSIISQGLPLEQALGTSSAFEGDVAEYPWIGNMSQSNQIFAVWHTSPTTSIDDGKDRATTMGTTGGGSLADQLINFMNGVLGTQFVPISGYAGGNEINLAMERGEVEGRGNTWAAFSTTAPHWVSEELIVPLVQIGLTPDPALPGVPMLTDLAENDEELALTRFISNAVAVGRPIATAPGTPPERVEALRRAFDATLADPEFIAEAELIGAEIGAMTGEDLEQAINDLLATPDDIRARAKDVIEGQ